jgi:hypothetical protein
MFSYKTVEICMGADGWLYPDYSRELSSADVLSTIISIQSLKLPLFGSLRKWYYGENQEPAL